MGNDKTPEFKVEWAQPGPSPYPAGVTFSKQYINEKPAFMEIRVQGPSKDGLAQGPIAAVLVSLKDWEDLQLKLMS